MAASSARNVRYKHSNAAYYDGSPRDRKRNEFGHYNNHGGAHATMGYTGNPPITTHTADDCLVPLWQTPDGPIRTGYSEAHEALAEVGNGINN